MEGDEGLGQSDKHVYGSTTRGSEEEKSLINCG